MATVKLWEKATFDFMAYATRPQLRLQAALDFHVDEPPLLLLRARSNSQDINRRA